MAKRGAGSILYIQVLLRFDFNVLWADLKRPINILKFWQDPMNEFDKKRLH